MASSPIRRGAILVLLVGVSVVAAVRARPLARFRLHGATVAVARLDARVVDLARGKASNELAEAVLARDRALLEHDELEAQEAVVNGTAALPADAAWLASRAVVVATAERSLRTTARWFLIGSGCTAELASHVAALPRDDPRTEVIAPAARAFIEAAAAVIRTTPPDGKTINVDLEDADLGEAMEAIGKQVGQRIVVEKSVNERVTVSLYDIRWRDAADVIARMAKCEVRVAADGTLAVEQPSGFIMIQGGGDTRIRVIVSLLAAYTGNNCVVVAPDVQGVCGVDPGPGSLARILRRIAERTGSPCAGRTTRSSSRATRSPGASSCTSFRASDRAPRRRRCARTRTAPRSATVIAEE